MIFFLLFDIFLNVASSSFHGPHHPRNISHHHYTPQGQIKLTQDKNLLQDTVHLKEDLGPIADKLNITNISKQELEFYYFKLHDIDNNIKLDGLEILHAIQHTLHDNKENYTNEIVDNQIIQEDFIWIVELIDKVLEEDDLDNDGFLGYIEFKDGKKRNTYDKKNIFGKMQTYY